MARIRSIKPEFWTSEQVVECSREARLLFIGLWNFADDRGIHPSSERVIKMRVFPADDDITSSNVRRMVDELLSRHLLIEYEVEGQRFLKVTGWERHQRIDKPSYKYPVPTPDSPILPTPSPTVRRALVEDLPPERREGEEGKEGEETVADQSTTRRRKLAQPTQLSPAWTLPDDWRADAASRRTAAKLPPANLDLEAVRFRDYWTRKGTARADWRATWLNWILRSDPAKPTNGNGHAGNGHLPLSPPPPRTPEEAAERGRKARLKAALRDVQLDLDIGKITDDEAKQRRIDAYRAAGEEFPR